jgi:flagellar biogenesis protein FliO
MIKAVRATIIILLCLCGNAFAQNMAGDSVSQISTPGITDQMAPTLFRLGIALLVIVVLIYLSVLMLKKVSNARMGKQSLPGTINVVDRHHLSPKKQLCLIKVDKKYLLVGVTEQSVNLVADVSDQNFERKEAIAKPQYQGFSFKKFLSDAKTNLPMFSHADSPQKS